MRTFQKIIYLLALMLLGCLGSEGVEKAVNSIDFPGDALSPVSINNPACPNLSGDYRDVKASLLRQFPDPNNQNAVSVREDVLAGKMIYPSQGEPFYFHETEQFHQHAIQRIQQDDALIITLMDEKGKAYKRTIISFDTPMIGCRNGTLVIRKSFVTTGSVEGGGGFSRATENQFQKLSNGNLEVQSKNREWFFSRTKGFIGIDSNNSEGGTEPRKREWTLIFPTVK